MNCLKLRWNEPLKTWRLFFEDRVGAAFRDTASRGPAGPGTPAGPSVFREAASRLSYKELNAKANQLAHYLQTLGVGPEVLVGICVERSPEMIVGILGILKAGGAYVPLDPNYPKERLAFMLKDARVSVLLTQDKIVKRLPEHEAKVVCLDTDWGKIAADSQNLKKNPVNKATPGNLAYVIYTSGSTGRPKGVMIEHQGLCNLSETQIHTFGLHSKNRILQFASLSFDASIFEIVMALRVGATLYLATQELLLPGPELIQLLEEKAITNITIPPSILASLPIKKLPNLHTIITAGEACTTELAKRWSKNHRFFNAYGPTEKRSLG